MYGGGYGGMSSYGSSYGGGMGGYGGLSSSYGGGLGSSYGSRYGGAYENPTRRTATCITALT